MRQQTAARERRLCASSSSSCGCCSTRFSFSRKNVQSHHMVRWRRDKTGPLRDITKVVPFEFCARKEEEEKGWGGGNPNVGQSTRVISHQRRWQLVSLLLLPSIDNNSSSEKRNEHPSRRQTPFERKDKNKNNKKEEEMIADRHPDSHGEF